MEISEFNLETADTAGCRRAGGGQVEGTENRTAHLSAPVGTHHSTLDKLDYNRLARTTVLLLLIVLVHSTLGQPNAGPGGALLLLTPTLPTTNVKSKGLQ